MLNGEGYNGNDVELKNKDQELIFHRDREQDEDASPTKEPNQSETIDNTQTETI
jgi:hypothetical protein